MDTNKPNYSQIDRRQLTIEQQAQIEQLEALQDVSAALEAVTIAIAEGQDKDETATENLGRLLMGVRESLQDIKNKKDPEAPNFDTKPITDALSGLEKNLTKALDKIEVNPEFRPEIKVDAPQVNISPPDVDLSGVERVLKSDLPKAFDRAIKAIPKTQINQNFEPVTNILKEISEQLESLETATRMKPIAGNVGIKTNGQVVSASNPLPVTVDLQIIDNETPSGSINDVNTLFTTFYDYKPGTTKVFLNGLRQREGVGYDYYESGANQITYGVAPQTGDTISIDYMKL